MRKYGAGIGDTRYAIADKSGRARASADAPDDAEDEARPNRLSQTRAFAKRKRGRAAKIERLLRSHGGEQ